MKALVVLALLAGTARADDQVEAHNKLGFRIGFGTLEVTGRETDTCSLGLNLEHPVWTSVRAFGEYELMFLGNAQSMNADADSEPGSGHRMHAGLRAELMAKSIGGMVRFYVDGELGAGIGVAGDDVMGVQVMPHAFVGVRMGYDFLWGKTKARSSRSFEAEFLARAFRMPDGGSATLFGVGMAWGD